MNVTSNSEFSMEMPQLESLEKWCYEQFTIRHYNRNFLKHFYVRNNKNMNACKEKLRQYFIHKKLYPEYLQAGNMTDENFRTFCKSVYSLYLPLLTTNGYRIYFDKITDDENLFDVVMIMKYFNMQTDLRYSMDPVDNGEIILFDCNNINLFALFAFVPYFMKTLSLVLQVYPMKLNLLILINSSVIMKIFTSIIKLGLPAKYQQMFYVYSEGAENFIKHVEKDVLPRDYGGKLPSLDELRDEWIDRLDSQNFWFQETVTEINSIFFNSIDIKMYGTNGSFRNLQID